MENIKASAIQIGIETICFIVAGILLIGFYIIDPHNTLFSFTIFGFSAVLFYQILVNSDTRNFILWGILISLITTILFKPNYYYHIVIYVENFCWFVCIGLVVYFLAFIGKKGWYKESKLWILTSWFIGFIVIYVVMTIMNIYVFDLYKTNHQITVFFYLPLAIKIGGTLGLGIGLGNLISSFIVNKKIVQTET